MLLKFKNKHIMEACRWASKRAMQPRQDFVDEGYDLMVAEYSNDELAENLSFLILGEWIGSLEPISYKIITGGTHAGNNDDGVEEVLRHIGSALARGSNPEGIERSLTQGV